MDERTSIEELKEAVKRFCGERDWDQFNNAKDLAIGIVTEAAELIDIFRFKSAEDVNRMFEDSGKRSKICEELVDVLYFVLRFAQCFDIDLSSEFYRKMGQNAAKYPVEKFKGINMKYNEV
jgi:NTP pyrophosphatase (non-canonical NTP hydrolase)